MCRGAKALRFHEGHDGDDDDEARRSESRSWRTTCTAVRIDQDNISKVYYNTIRGLPVRIDQEVEMTDRSEESSPYIHEYSRAGCTIT